MHVGSKATWYCNLKVVQKMPKSETKHSKLLVIDENRSPIFIDTSNHQITEEEPASDHCFTDLHNQVK